MASSWNQLDEIHDGTEVNRGRDGAAAADGDGGGDGACGEDDLDFLFVCNFWLGVILSFPETFLNFMLTDAFEPAEMQLMWCALYSPWMAKVVFARIVDAGFAPPHAFAQAMTPLSCLMWGAMAFATSARSTVLLFVAVSFCVSFADVAIDTVMVRRSKCDENQQTVQSQSLLWRSVGCAIGAYGGGWTFQHGGRNEVLAVCIVTTMFLTTATFLLPKVRMKATPTEGRGRRRVGFVRFFVETSTDYKKALLFNALVHSVPDAMALFDYFQIEQLKFTPVMIGTLEMIGSVAMTFGAYAYHAFHARCSPRTFVMLALAMYSFETAFFPSMLIGRVNLRMGIPDGAWAITDGLFRSMGRKMLSMPMQGGILHMCSNGDESTVYALFNNVSNLSSLTASLLGSAFATALGINRDSMDALWIICVTRGACFLALVGAARCLLVGGTPKRNLGEAVANVTDDASDDAL